MNYTPQKNSKKYYLKVREDGTIYVWNMNYPTIITKDTIDKAYRDWYTSSKGNVKKYDRNYYNNKLKEGAGKPGSDCSGMHYGLSGYDKTAQGYYNEEPEDKKGTFDTLPLHDLVLVYKGQSASSITHTGVYLGNGMVIHMKNSNENCVYEPVDKHGWKYWSYAKFIDYSKKLGAKPILTRIIKMGSKGVDVKLAQEQLNKKKFDCGIVDGDFGNKTKKAVEKFQAANDLTVDGIIGEATCKALGMKWKPNYANYKKK